MDYHKDFRLQKKRGIVVLITLDYKDSCVKRILHQADLDAKEMKTTFNKLNYDIIQLQNKEATKLAITTTLRQLSHYLSQYNAHTIKSLVFAFSGHGDGNGKLICHDGRILSLKSDILPYFVSHRNIYNIPKLFFIDACRGDRELTMNYRKITINACRKICEFIKAIIYQVVGENKTLSHKEENFLIAYSTIDGHVSREGRWMRNLAKRIRNEINVPLSKILDDLSGDVKGMKWKPDQLSEYTSRLRRSFNFGAK